jgi:hypothetical protein
MDLLSHFGNLWRSGQSSHGHRVLQSQPRVRPSGAANYVYEALPDPSHIRTFALEPGPFDADIVLHFNISHSSKDVAPPEYEAISYVWGLETDKTFVYVGNLSTTVTVPQNLEVALRYLRHEAKPRYLWADSICINQENMEEKGPQVAMMGQIFRLATRVLFWLGSEDATSSLAMDMMQEIGSQVVVNWPPVDPTLVPLAIRPAPDAKNTDWGDEAKNISLKEREAEAIYKLTSRAWFTRLWIRQEIFLASIESTVICGGSHVLWTTFRYALTVLCRKSFSPGITSSLSMRFGQFESDFLGLIYQKKCTFSELRARFGTTNCKDPRDRIYAITSQIESETLASSIQPDYNKKVSEVYQDATLNYFYEVGNRNILEECQWYPDSSAPSWVPDWSRKTIFEKSLGFQDASSGVISALSFTEPNKLTLDGVIITKPTKLFSFSLNADSTSSDLVKHIDKFVDVLRNCLQADDTPVEDRPRRISEVLKRFTQALMINMNAEHCELPSGPTLSDSMQCLSRLLAYEDNVDHLNTLDDQQMRTFLSHVKDLLVGRKLFTTDEGYIGVVSAHAKETDVISVILGLAIPAVLRPIGDEQYILVGQCFLPGFDHGEAILGPLPDEVEPVFVERFGQWLFRNKNTGVVSPEDPRFCRLPIDLEPFREAWENNRRPWCVVDPPALRAAGIHVQKFTLV